MMKNLLLLTLFLFTLVSCQNKKENDIDQSLIDDTLKSLKKGETKILLELDGKPFYQEDHIFKGDVTLFDNLFRFSLFDQYESNVIVAVSANGWYQQKPISRQIIQNDQKTASVMIGKLIDKENNVGEGYLMTDGKIDFISLNKSKTVLKITGLVGKYNAQRMPDKWQKLEGYIILKEPTIILSNLEEKQVFY
ncbi:MAG: hypothetical protein ACK4R6_12755 [Spirosomataceae bacterium]